MMMHFRRQTPLKESVAKTVINRGALVNKWKLGEVLKSGIKVKGIN